MSETSNDFFWQDLQTSDSSSDLELQRMALGGFVSQDQTQLQVQIQPEESHSPPSMVSNMGNNNNNNSPSASQQSLLPLGVINPDAIIPQSRSYTCRICQVTFPNKSAVTVHSKSHTNHEGKPYRCAFCNKGFSTNFYLKQHERIHNGQKPYKCPMCDNSFKQLSHVQQHVRTHTGVRPYKCNWPGCGKAFLQQSHLKSHIARHSPKPNNGVRPFKCHWPDCGKSFAQISNLKSHIARHTPKPQKQKKGAIEQKNPPIEQHFLECQTKSELESIDGGSFSVVSISPDVIGQAAAAANIVPVQTQLGDYESICPFLCPGCSKLYVREATFKKHLEECKTKLQLSISATAAALGIEPSPLPPAGSQFVGNEISFMPEDITLAVVDDPASGETPAKKSRKSQKPRQTRINVQQFIDHSQQQGPIIVELPLDVSLGNCSPHLSDGSLGDGNVKQEVLNIDATSSGNVMFKLPQHLLNDAVGGNGNDDSCNVSVTNVNSFFSTASYNQPASQLMDHSLFSNQHLVTSSPVSLPFVVSQPVTSSQSGMLSGVSISIGNVKPNVSTKVETSNPGHSTINQAALRWQWDQSAPRMNFP